MLRQVILLAMAVAVCYGELIAVNFNCETMIPLDKEASEARQDSNFKISLNPPANFAAGETVTVVFESKKVPFNSFMIQARKPGTSEPVGSWDTEESPFYRTFSCSTSDSSRPQNTIMVAAREQGRAAPEFERVELKWIPSPGAGQVEFIGTFVEEEDDATVRSFWMDVVSSILTETHPEL